MENKGNCGETCFFMLKKALIWNAYVLISTEDNVGQLCDVPVLEGQMGSSHRFMKN